MPATFRCSLVTPEKSLLDDEVTYASVPAWDGLVGLAPQRAPLLVKLGQGALRLDFAQGGSRYFVVSGGFAQMKDNRLTLVTAEATPAENLVGSEARAALSEAQARVALGDEDYARKQRDLARARTMVKLSEQK